MLSDYYGLLNFSQLFLFFGIVLAGEMVGALTIDRYKTDHLVFFRWVIGLSLFSTIWYFFSKRIGFNPKYICLLFLVITVVSAYMYIKKGMWYAFTRRSLFELWPLLFVLPLSFALYIKVSLPPYFADEIGYHYYSPSEIRYFDKLEQRENLYFFLPQTLDNIYRLSFALSKTYAVARLLQFSIISSALLTVGLWIKKKLGNTAYFIWGAFFWYIAANFTSMSTNGLVDMGTAGVVLTFIIVVLESIDRRTFKNIPLLGILSGIAVGFKLSALVPLLSFSVVFFIFNRRLIMKKFSLFLQECLWGFTLFVVFGGYWLIRSYSYTGVFFPGIGNLGSFFSGWTVPILPLNPLNVSRELFTGNYWFGIPLFVSFVVILLFMKKYPTSVKALICGWIFEWLIVNKFGGFIVRYYFHWIYIAFLVILLPIGLYKHHRLLTAIYGSVLVLFLCVNAYHVTSFVYSSYFTPPIEKEYAMGRISIYDWVKRKIPNTYNIIGECDSGSLKGKNLFVTDPDLMWIGRDVDFQGFLTECRLYFLDLGHKNVVDFAKNVRSKRVIVASMSECVSDFNAIDHLHHIPEYPNWSELVSYPYALEQRTMNNELVCTGRMISKNLYEIENQDFVDVLNRYSGQVLP